MKRIYEPKFVEKLFDRMSHSYTRMNQITSFGFNERWRKQFISNLNIQKGKTVVDLMTGMGECWEYIFETSNHESKLIALDFSSKMLEKATLKKSIFKERSIEILNENLFKNSIDNEIADYVVSGFGLKTFNEEQIELLAIEINRILKPNGKFSLIDISVPKNSILKTFYMFYLEKVIPILGYIFLGNTETYKMLGVYTKNYSNSSRVKLIFERANMEVEYIEYFFGCATGVTGRKKL